VAKVSKILLAADLVETQRGVRGGYRLIKASADISLVDIVEAMEGPIAVTVCVDEAQAASAISNSCSMGSPSNHVNLAIRNALNDVSLEDLTDPAQSVPLPVSPSITEDDRQFSRQ
jgi:Rrf2 family protein